jgi:hypothetical protein
VTTEDGAAVVDAGDRRSTAAPLTGTVSSGPSLALAGMFCGDDDAAATVLTGGGEVSRQGCPDAYVSGLAAQPTTWAAAVAGTRRDAQPAALLIAAL